VVLTKKNLFQHMYSYAGATHLRQVKSFVETLAEMINSHKFILTPTMIMHSAGTMRAAAADAFWKTVHNEYVSVAEVGSMLLPDTYGATPGAPVQHMRAFANTHIPMPPTVPAPSDPPARRRRAVVDDDDDEDAPTTTAYAAIRPHLPSSLTEEDVVDASLASIVAEQHRRRLRRRLEDVSIVCAICMRARASHVRGRSRSVCVRCACAGTNHDAGGLRAAGHATGLC
jgi:hypothetical protein